MHGAVLLRDTSLAGDKVKLVDPNNVGKLNLIINSLCTIKGCKKCKEDNFEECDECGPTLIKSVDDKACNKC